MGNGFASLDLRHSLRPRETGPTDLSLWIAMIIHALGRWVIQAQPSAIRLLLLLSLISFLTTLFSLQLHVSAPFHAPVLASALAAAGRIPLPCSHRKDQKKVDKLEAQIPYHEGRGNKEEVEKIRDQVAAIWAKTREAALA